MRIYSAIAVALILPSIAFAQGRAPRIGGARPGQPVPLGPQPEIVARAIAIQRSHYSVETYPLISRVQAPGYAAGRPISGWTSFGSGTRLDYRLTRFVSWTVDLTSSYLGGPATFETAELGTRLRPENWDYRLRPFADIRAGFEYSSGQYASPVDLGIGPASSLAMGSRYSRGFGGVAGAGLEYSLTNTFALTTALSAMRSNMTTYRYVGAPGPTTGDSYRMTTYRLAIGLKYNPVREIRSTQQSTR
ncbi:MAG: hypothetical protein ABI625_09465 [bacterium]